MTRCNRENINYVILILFHFLSLLSSCEAPIIIKVKLSTREMLVETQSFKGIGKETVFSHPYFFPRRWCRGSRKEASPQTHGESTRQNHLAGYERMLPTRHHMASGIDGKQAIIPQNALNIMESKLSNYQSAL